MHFFLKRRGEWRKGRRDRQAGRQTDRQTDRDKWNHPGNGATHITDAVGSRHRHRAAQQRHMGCRYDKKNKKRREKKPSLPTRPEDRGERERARATPRRRRAHTLREGHGEKRKRKRKRSRLMVQLIIILVDYFCVSCRLLLLVGRVMLVGGENV